MVAAATEHPDMVTFLASRGADLESADVVSQTSLWGPLSS